MIPYLIQQIDTDSQHKIIIDKEKQDYATILDILSTNIVALSILLTKNMGIF